MHPAAKKFDWEVIKKISTLAVIRYSASINNTDTEKENTQY